MHPSRRALLLAACSTTLLASCARSEWGLTPEQRDKLVETFRAAPPFPFKIIIAPGRPEAIVFGYDLFNVLANRALWPVSIHPFDAENSPSVEGINVAKGPGPLNYPERPSILLGLLRGSGVKVNNAMIVDRRLGPEETAIVIGKRP